MLALLIRYLVACYLSMEHQLCSMTDAQCNNDDNDNLMFNYVSTTL